MARPIFVTQTIGLVVQAVAIIAVGRVIPGVSVEGTPTAVWGGVANHVQLFKLLMLACLVGCLLLADDPFAGLELGADCRWRLTDAPGHGVTRRSDR